MRNRVFFFLDALLLTAAVFGAYTIRFEGFAWWPTHGAVALWFLCLAVPAKLVLFFATGLYRRLWRYASIAEMERLVFALVAGGVLSFVIGIGVLPLLQLAPHRIQLSVLFVDVLLTAASVVLPRLLARSLSRRGRPQAIGEQRRVLIVGAGAAGGMIAKELHDNPQLGMVPVGYLDDDRTKHRHWLHGTRVLGAISLLPQFVDRLAVDEIVVAMPSAPGKVVREVFRLAAAAGVRTRTVPGIYEILSGRKSVSALRQIEIEDLLRREPTQTDLEQVSALVTGSTVLVTGAGGSIGSELCRQLAQLDPGQLIILGRGENSIFELAGEMKRTFPDLNVESVIADVRDRTRIASTLKKHRPFTIFHAAAHKHVPLMERNVSEAVLNNVLGTRNLVDLATCVGTQHFVLISTDKAVRPTSVMGATKRIAEMIVHRVADENRRRFVSVRFGNVLGSRGSVVPTFLREIAAGGPISITHPDMRRYFMTIPEAVQLVLQAAALGRGSESFVLDMGEPVHIVDLAKDLIRLSGLEVDTDIEIRFCGVRPGEKLYEELFFSPEHASPTNHPKILRAKDSDFRLIDEGLLDELIEAARADAPASELQRLMKTIVPDYAFQTGAREAPATDAIGFHLHSSPARAKL